MTILTTNYQPEYFTPGETNDAGDEITVFRFLFPIIGRIALEVYEITLEGVRTLVPLDHYDVIFAGSAGARRISTGGRVTFTRPYRDDTFVVSIERNTPITQLADFKKYGLFHMDAIEQTMDKITMILQEIAFRKCNKYCRAYATTEITQLVDFYPYGPLRASTLDHVIDKATAIAVEIKAAKNDCSNDLENT